MGHPLLYWKFIFFLQHFASFSGTGFFFFFLFYQTLIQSPSEAIPSSLMENPTLSAILEATDGTALQERGELPADMAKHLDWNIYVAYMEHCTVQPAWSGPSRLCNEQRRRVKNRHLAQETRDRRTAELARLIATLHDKTHECAELHQQIASLWSTVAQQQAELAQLRANNADAEPTQCHTPDTLTMDGLTFAEGHHCILWGGELNGM